MKTRTVIDVIVIILLISSMLGLVWNYSIIKTKGFQCIQNPLTYSAEFYGSEYDFTPSGRLYGFKGVTSIDITFNSTDVLIKRETPF